MTARVAHPLAKVIAIYEAPGQQKEIAHRFGVPQSTVSQIKSLRRHGPAIRRHLEDKARAEAAALTTKAFYPQLSIEWGV